MLIVFDEHVDAVLGGCECCVCHTGQELLGDASAVDASFCLIELIYKRDLDRLLESFTKFVEL